MDNKEFKEENTNEITEPAESGVTEEKNEEAQDKPALAPLERPFIFDLGKRWTVLLSFLMPFLICTVVYLVAGYYPIGDKQIIVTDFWHQYYPIIRELRETLLEGGSLLWNWHSGLGTNFLAMLGYYGASPLNLLTVFMPESFLQLGVTLIVFIKIGLCGMFFSIFLSKAFERRDISVILFSCLYATCACIMGYYWNLMWLDSIAMFPLVILGVILLIRDKKPLLYTVSLALALIFNYYIGVYICIAVLLFSICTTVITWKSLKEAFLSFFRMVTHSLIGIGITAALLLPSYLSLQNSYYASNSSVGEKLWNGNVPEFLSALFPYQYPNTKDLNTPNLCCGLICIFLFVIFLCGKAKIREKICSCALLAVLFFSFMYRPLDYLWNGAHYVNMIPFRYSFIFSFVLIACAYRAFCLLDKVNILQIMAALEVTVVGACLMYQYLSVTVILLCVGTAVLYTAAVFLYERRKIGARFTAIMLCTLIAVECAAAGAYGVSEYSVYSSYLTHSEDINALFDSIEDEGFYRTEMTNTKTLNDPLLYGYNGASQFSSNANGRISAYMKHVGVGGNPAGNRYVYYQSTPFINSTLTVNYLVSKVGSNTGDSSLTLQEESGECALYKNEYPLPVAFTVNENVSTEGFVNYKPFDNQNDIFTAMTGIEEPLFNDSSKMTASAVGGSITGANGNFKFTNTTESVTLYFNIKCESAGLYYIYPRIYGASSVTIIQNGIKTAFNCKHTQASILPAGYHEAGDVITVSCKVEGDGEKHNAIMEYAIMDQEVFERGYEILSENALADVTYTDTSIAGKITAPEDTLLYTSIPYEKGWRAYVDGKQVEVNTYADAFVSIDLPAGEHTVSFEYTPDGFTVGVAVSLLGIAACVLSGILYRRKKKKEEAALPPDDTPPSELPNNEEASDEGTTEE